MSNSQPFLFNICFNYDFLKFQNHFDNVYVIMDKVLTREIPVIEIGSLMDPQVLDFLKHVGLKEADINAFRRDVEQLCLLHTLYGGIYAKFSRFNCNPGKEAEDEQEPLEENQVAETVLVLNATEWESFLNDIDPERSILKLKNALSMEKPLGAKEANWLDRIKDCQLFMEKIWQPGVVFDDLPLRGENLSSFVNDCAFRWLQLATNVAKGLVPFKEMEKLVQLQPDAKLLSEVHLGVQTNPIVFVKHSYRDFRSLSEIRLLIAPFVAALRLFSIDERTPIDELFNFVKEALVDNWDGTVIHFLNMQILKLID